MATATKKSHTTRKVAHSPAAAPVRAPMEFLIFEDNGGSYHWKILAGDGTALGRSGDFGSYDDAEQAAQDIVDGAASARFERRANANGPVDLAARRAAPDDDSAAGRRLDKGGSVSGEAVARWPAPR